MLARDSLGDDDFVEVMLDTFDDQRRAFMFDSNALGIQGDGLYSEQNAADYSFDTVWDTWPSAHRLDTWCSCASLLPASISRRRIRADADLGHYPATKYFACQ